MKKILYAIIFISPLWCMAQSGDANNKSETIIINRKGNTNEKLNIVIDGRAITVNGKSINDDSTISIQRYNSPRNVMGFSINNQPSFNLSELLDKLPANKAFLGVATSAQDVGGLIINNVVPNSAADKAGLKEGDILLSVDGKNLTTPDELSELIKSKKVGTAISIRYSRDKKIKTTDVLLNSTAINKIKIDNLIFKSDSSNFNMPFGNREFELFNNGTFGSPNNITRNRIVMGENLYNNSSKLGIQIQDGENADVVKIIKVESKSVAEKAGLKEGDIIKKVNDKNITSVNQAIAVIGVAKTKPEFTVTFNRKGKDQTVTIKMNKKLNNAEL